MTYVKFNPTDHQKYDKTCKEYGIEILQHVFKNCKIYENPDQYGVDIIVEWERKGKIIKVYFEVEYKNYFNKNVLAEEGIHIAYRKRRYYVKSPHVHHITFLDDYKKAVLMINKVLRKSEIIRKFCKRGNIEYPTHRFISVDLKKCLLLKEVDGKWKKSPIESW